MIISKSTWKLHKTMSDRANILMKPVKLMSYPDKVTNFEEDQGGPNPNPNRSYCALQIVLCSLMSYPMYEMYTFTSGLRDAVLLGIFIHHTG